MRQIVLLVDDEPNVTSALKRRMRQESFEVVTAASGEEALKILESRSVDLVVSDEQMPGMRGSELLSIIAQRWPQTVRMTLTGHASLDAAIRAINEGQIYRFFVKPCNETDLLFSIRHALEQKRLSSENVRLSKELKSKTALLDHLEQENPGITQIDTDEDGALLIDADALEEEVLS